MLNITVTDAAANRLREIAPQGLIRLNIGKTGCSGHSYKLDRVENADESDDVVALDGVSLAIPKSVSWMLIGTTIDYEETDFSAEFVFINPNEKGRCGCGESFSV